jgi:hypothetical protein
MTILMNDSVGLGRPSEPADSRLLLRWTGIAGVSAIVMLAAFLAVSTHLGSDPLSASGQSLNRSLSAQRGAGLATTVLLVSALSYIPLIGFFAGLRRVLELLDLTGMAAAVVGIAAPLFLAGAVASDGFNLALAVAQHAVGAHPSAASVQLFAAGWRVCLVEAQTALACVCVAGAVGVLRASRADAIIAVPRWVGYWGLVAAVAVLPLIAAPGTTPVFVASNLARFGWVLTFSVVLLRSGRGHRKGALA